MSLITAVFFLTLGLFNAYNAYRAGTRWFLLGSVCMVLFSPIAYFVSLTDALWIMVVGVLLLSVMIFSLVMGVVRGEPKRRLDRIR